MSGPSVFDDLPPHLLDAVAAKIAEAVHSGFEAGRKASADRYWRGYADAVAMMTGAEEGEVDEVDAEVLVDRPKVAR